MKAIIKGKILQVLYDAWERYNHYDLKQLSDENGWNFDTVEDVIDDLESDYLIERHLQRRYKLTAWGIDYAENQAIVPKDTVAKHRQTRQKILTALAAFRQKNGKREKIHFKILCEEYGIDRSLFLVDQEVLRKFGYIETVTIGTYRITREGMHHLGL